MTDNFGPMLAIVRKPLATVLVAFSLAIVAPGTFAQDADSSTAAPAVTPDTVVATVGDDTITEADIAFAAEDLQQELQQIPAADRKAFLITVLIDMKVMAQAARAQQMDQTEIFKRRLQYLEERALRRAFFSEKIAAEVTEEAVQAAYDEYVAGFQPQQEVRASHILVATLEDAEAIKAELANGKPFEALAMEKSTDPSARQNGGDLGFFGPGMMVKPFEDAAFALTEPGQLSEPVESQFGWHVIKLVEKRQSQPPTLDALRPQLQQQVMFQAFENSVGALKQGLAINIPDPALAEGVKRQSEQSAAQ